MERESKVAGIVAGLLLAITGALVAWSTSQMRVPPMHAKVGPQVFPYFAAAALAFLGLCFIVQALQRSGRELDRQRFMRAMESVTLDGPRGYQVHFGTGNRVGSRYTNFVMISEAGRITD